MTIYICYYLYKNITHHMCHYVFMYDGRDKNTNLMVQLNIYQTHMESWCKIKSIATRLEYLIDEREDEIDNYS